MKTATTKTAPTRAPSCARRSCGSACCCCWRSWARWCSATASPTWRASRAEYQRRIQQTLSGSLRDIKAGSGSLALWTLATVCFGYGVVHTLGPGHGKAVVVAYFLDSTRPRAWIEGVFAGAWIAFTHTLAALLLAGALKLLGDGRPAGRAARGAQRRDGLVPADPG